jgi:hypothetical protein
MSPVRPRSKSDGFDSVQRAELPAPAVERTAAGARRLGELYWREVERSTLGLVRARPAGGGRSLRLLGVGPALLRFGRPELSASAGGVRCRYPITGGLLARAAVGAISFAQTGSDGVEVCSAINGFVPRLAARPGRPRWQGFLYAQVQARLHEAVARRYFARLGREASR